MSEGNIDNITTDIFVINNVDAYIGKFIIILVSSALDRLQKGQNYPRGDQTDPRGDGLTIPEMGGQTEMISELGQGVQQSNRPSLISKMICDLKSRVSQKCPW